MKYLISIIFLTFSYCITNAQINSGNHNPDTNKVFGEPMETAPEYPGGSKALAAYLSDNIHYPATAKKNNIQGRAILDFIVEKNGEINDVRIIRHLSPLLDSEAVRVIKGMPKWKPGTQNYKPIRVRYALPINFALLSKK